jgi:hypothetical protein
MNKEEILHQWLSVKSNYDKLPVLSISNEVAQYIKSTAIMHNHSYGEVFEINNILFRVA